MNKEEIILELQRNPGYKTWVGKSDVKMLDCDKFGTVRVIIKDRQRYSLLRFFKLLVSGNTRWQVCCDINNASPEDVMNKLLIQLTEEISYQ